MEQLQRTLEKRHEEGEIIYGPQIVRKRPDGNSCAKIKGKWYAHPDMRMHFQISRGKYEVNGGDVTDKRDNTELKNWLLLMTESKI